MNCKIDQLEKELERSAERGSSSSAVPPFYILVYDPSREIDCLRHFQTLAKRLRNKRIKVQEIFMGEILVKALRDIGYFTEEILSSEIEFSDTIVKELQQLLPDVITHMLLEGISGKFEGIGDGNPSSIALLLRTGALFPFLHISTVLERLVNKTYWTLGIAFPGYFDKLNPEKLQFLGETEGVYYRAHILPDIAKL